MAGYETNACKLFLLLTRLTGLTRLTNTFLGFFATVNLVRTVSRLTGVNRSNLWLTEVELG